MVRAIRFWGLAAKLITDNPQHSGGRETAMCRPVEATPCSERAAGTPTWRIRALCGCCTGCCSPRGPSSRSGGWLSRVQRRRVCRLFAFESGVRGVAIRG